MIQETILEIKMTTQELIDSVNLDIADVKAANHEKLLVRNDKKLELMESLANAKLKLNEELTVEFKSGNDITIYKESIDNIEVQLKELYVLNAKLGAIVLPVKEMYKDIIDEIKSVNGGSIIEVMA